MEKMEKSLAMEEKVLCQALVAFGAGAGPLRVPRLTCQAIHDHYLDYLRRDEVRKLLEDPADPWGQPQHGPQALERVRMTGRLAAALATQEGRTAINAGHFTTAAQRVESDSYRIMGSWCPPLPLPWPLGEHPSRSGGKDRKQRRSLRDHGATGAERLAPQQGPAMPAVMDSWSPPPWPPEPSSVS